MTIGRLISVQVGQPRQLVTAKGKVWESAIVKEAVSGPVEVGRENVNGDRQANRRFHGGPDKAVCCYSSEHYSDWNTEFLLEMPYGAFGENLTVSGLTEEQICIGDTLSVGQVRLQISQPRMPCVNVSKRWDRPKLPKRMEETGHTGFYCRVLQPGILESGQAVTVSDRPNPDWTVLRANNILYAALPDLDALSALNEVPLLSGEWRRVTARMLRRDSGTEA